MITKRNAIFLLLIIVLSCTFISCGNKKKSDKSSEKYIKENVTISGDEGKELDIKIPKDIKTGSEDAFYVLREGTGKPITENNEAYFRVQKVGLHDTSKVYSSFGKDGEEMSVDLQEAYKDQVPTELRNILLKSKVGAVIAFTTKGPLSELSDDETSNKEVKQIWIITITRIGDVARPVE